MKKQAAIKSVFNSANLNGLSAVLLSRGMGDSFGLGLFLVAMAAGTRNKYMSLTRPAPGEGEKVSGSYLARLSRDPSLTAKIFMLAAGWNCVSKTFETMAGEPADRLKNACYAAAWFLGVVGDNALRKLDKTNFSAILEKSAHKMSPFRAGFSIAAANPTIFYSAVGFAMTAGLLQETRPSRLALGFSVATAASHAAGIAHALRRGWQAARGQILPEQINDGTLNALCAAGSLIGGALAVVTGQGWIAASSTLFAASTIKALYETRSALRRTGRTP